MGNLCSNTLQPKSQWRKKTWENATADLSSSIHRGKFSPLIELKGGNGFPFKTRDNIDFIKVIMKSKTNSATSVIFNLRKLKQDIGKQLYIMLPHKIVETKFAYHVYYLYVEHDLINYMCEHDITPNERDAMFTQLTSAVQFLHNNGYVHRDIKMENILMHNNVPILCDLDHTSKAEMYCPRGTKAYMPTKHILKALCQSNSMNMEEKSKWIDCYAFGKTIATIIFYTSNDIAYEKIYYTWLKNSQVSISDVYIDKYDFCLKTTWWNQVFNFCDTNEKFIFDNTYTLYTINDKSVCDNSDKTVDDLFVTT